MNQQEKALPSALDIQNTIWFLVTFATPYSEDQAVYRNILEIKITALSSHSSGLSSYACKSHLKDVLDSKLNATSSVGHLSHSFLLWGGDFTFLKRTLLKNSKSVHSVESCFSSLSVGENTHTQNAHAMETCMPPQIKVFESSLKQFTARTSVFHLYIHLFHSCH